MSLLTLLIISSLVAALALFSAGYLLAPRRSRSETASEPRQSESPSRGEEDLQHRLAILEKERDSAREQSERLDAKTRTLAERLRKAEDENRAAFEREEKAAEAWASQLESAKLEQKRHDQALERQVEELRTQLAQERAERERLTALAGQNAVGAEHESAALEALREQNRLEEKRRGEQFELELARLTKAAEQASDRERDVLERLAASESALQSKTKAVEEGLQAKLVAAEGELTRLAEQLQRGQAERQASEDEKLSLSLRVRAAEEVAEQRKMEVLEVVESLRITEARLEEREGLVRENAELREQQAHAEQEAIQQGQRDEEVKDAKVQLSAAQAKLAELERTVEENRRLRDQVAELRTHEEASKELERLTVAHKQVRLDAELMARRLQELLHDQAELTPLRAQAAEAASLAQEVEYLRRREKDLEAQLYASGSFASREMPAVSGEIPVVTPGSDLETNLSALVGEGGPRTAVLADAQGFLIASAGESVTEEGLAAFAAVAGEMVSRARKLLPLADVDSVRVTDTNRMVLTCHLFASAGEGLGLATLGSAAPEPESTARAIAGVTAIVSGPVVEDETADGVAQADAAQSRHP